VILRKLAIPYEWAEIHPNIFAAHGMMPILFRISHLASLLSYARKYPVQIEIGFQHRKGHRRLFEKEPECSLRPCRVSTQWRKNIPYLWYSESHDNSPLELSKITEARTSDNPTYPFQIPLTMRILVGFHNAPFSPIRYHNRYSSSIPNANKNASSLQTPDFLRTYIIKHAKDSNTCWTKNVVGEGK
jgi:hypothetical protein